MKKVAIIGWIGVLGLFACDKVDNPYPPTIDTELDESLYPGPWSDYENNEWPVFSANPNTQRSVLIEDFTGHLCTYCPPAADTAHALHNQYGDRVLAATIHAGPTGLGAFQETSTLFPIDWTNPEGLAIGAYFGGMAGSAFIGNPRGSVSRILTGGQYTQATGDWRSVVENALPSPLKVNLQSEANYYPSTRGVFLHAEVEVLDNAVLSDDLHIVVYLLEDSLVGKQKMPNNTTNENYVHRDIMRGCIGSTWQGRPIAEGDLENGKYYFNYSYKLPAHYDPSNVHFLIYVRGGKEADGYSEEIYHVIKQRID